MSKYKTIAIIAINLKQIHRGQFDSGVSVFKDN